MTLNRSKKRQSDPTGQASRRRRATKSLTTRLKRSQMGINVIVRGLSPERRRVTKIQNQTDQTIVYDYNLSPAELAAIEDQIRAIINRDLETGNEQPNPGWYWVDQVEPPFREGALEETNRVNQLIQAAIIAGLITDPFVQTVPVDAALTSREYQEALRTIVVENYSTIKSLSDRTAAQVIQQLNSGISAGLPRADIVKNIAGRFNVADSNAKRIADTEINRAYNDAKSNYRRMLNNTILRGTGIRAELLHISALLPTTRDSHALRHGNAYTDEDQQRWWNEDANRINCYCSTSTALIDNNGKVIQTEDQETLRAERKIFEGDKFTFEN